MRPRMKLFGALAVAVALVTGAVSALAAPPPGVSAFGGQPAASIAVRDAGIDAPAMYRFLLATPDTAMQTEPGTDQEATETEADVGQEAAENEAVETPGDEAVDGIDCVQEGENEGENAGC